MKLLPRVARTLCATLVVAASVAQAQPAFPSKPVRFVVPFAPGGQSAAAAIGIQAGMAARGTGAGPRNGRPPATVTRRIEPL